MIQMNERFNILKPGDFVIDCGAAPGSWSQVAATATNANQKGSLIESVCCRVIPRDVRECSSTSRDQCTRPCKSP